MVNEALNLAIGLEAATPDRSALQPCPRRADRDQVRGVHDVARVGARLFAAYAVLSLCVVVCLGVVLVKGYERTAMERGLAQGRQQAAVIEEMVIAPLLRTAAPGKPLSRTERRSLQRATDLAVFGGSVLYVRLRSFDGHVIFSDDGSTASSVATTSRPFRAALAGDVHSALVTLEGHDGPVIRVMQPVVGSTTGQAVGILEVYLPYDAIAEQIAIDTRQTFLRLALGLGALYALLALISWTTTAGLRRSAVAHRHASLHDSLTGLPNRDCFRARAEAAIRSQAGNGAIILIDLDHFKEVNDTLGHHAGDELLQVVATRLSRLLRATDVVARLGGDEFALALPGLTGADHVRAMLAELREDLSEEVVIAGVPLTIEASFGIACWPADGANLDELLKRADIAMYAAKRAGSGVTAYDAVHDDHTAERLGLHAELRRGIESDELVLLYQPQVDLFTGAVVGMEALVRWHHPERGLLGPASFLPVVEKSNLIYALTRWVLSRALSDAAAWAAEGHAWTLAVNVSARNIEAPGFVDEVLHALELSGCDPARLCVEITETALALDGHRAEQTIKGLIARGVGVAIDDFGSGYTCLAQLRTMPVREVKLDRTLVARVDHASRDQAVVRSVIELAHSLGSSVTAEGVETSTTAKWLAAAGCNTAQGYYFARPADWRSFVHAFSLEYAPMLVDVER